MNNLFPPLVLAALLAGAAANAGAQANFVEPPALQEEVKAGKLPAVAKRLPENPLVVKLAAGAQPGQHGGTLNMLIGRSRDIRMMVVYG